MKISKTSWHYRLMMQLFDHEWQIPADLCRYMRLLLWRSFWAAVFIVVAAVFLSGTFALFVLMPLATVVYYWVNPGLYEELQTQAHIGLLIWFAYAVVLVLYLAARGAVTMKDKRRARAKLPPAEPGIFAQRYRDWKNKVCTQLEFH